MNQLRYHLLALAACIVWGTTFVSTKVLINYGLTPASIFLYRFLIAYVAIWLIAPRRLWASSVADELTLLVAGIAGGSLYYILENSALRFTLATNVSFLVSTTPLLTALVIRYFHRGGERIRRSFVWGSMVALAGVACVVFNGRFILQLNPLGDTLTLLASLMWAIYGLAIKRIDARYEVLFITRKVFFYGLLTILPLFAWQRPVFGSVLLNPVVAGNLLFLGLMASMLCYVIWNVAVKHLGAVRASNYIYLNPLVTLITASLVLGEHITAVALAGGACILAGVYWAEQGR